MRDRRRWIVIAALIGATAIGAVLDSHHLFDGTRPLVDVIAGWDWIVISSMLVALGTIALAWQTRASVQELKREQDERHRAQVFSYAEVISGQICISVENRGEAPASSVRVEALDDVAWLRGDPQRYLTALPMAVGYLPAGVKVPLTPDPPMAWADSAVGRRKQVPF